MPTEIGFDYSGISTEHQDLIAEHLRTITAHMRQSTRSTIDIGRRLKCVYDLLGSRFKAWARAEFEWNYETAMHYIAMAERFGHLDCLDNFHQSALIVLLPKRVPAFAIERAIAHAQSGQIVSKRFAMDLVDNALLEVFKANDAQSSVSGSMRTHETPINRAEAATIERRIRYGSASRIVRSLNTSIRTVQKHVHDVPRLISAAECNAIAEELSQLANELMAEPVIEGDVESCEESAPFDAARDSRQPAGMT